MAAAARRAAALLAGSAVLLCASAITAPVTSCVNPYSTWDNSTAAVVSLLFRKQGCRRAQVCNGKQDDDVCTGSLLGPSRCGTTVFGTIEVDQYCPGMCGTCVATTPTSSSSTTSTATASSTTISSSTTTTTTTTTVPTTSTTTFTTTTTVACAGRVDEPDCGATAGLLKTEAAVANFCANNQLVRVQCPVLCNACPSTAAPVVTTTTLPPRYCAKPGNDDYGDYGDYGDDSSSSSSSYCGQTSFSAAVPGGGLCYCDSSCKAAEDCCSDYCDICEDALPPAGGGAGACTPKAVVTLPTTTRVAPSGDTGTCAGACGKIGARTDPGVPSRCWCNELCKTVGDCCDDYADRCDTTTTSTSSSLSSATQSSTSTTTSATIKSSTSTVTSGTTSTTTSTSTSPRPPKNCDAMLADIVFVFDCSRSVGAAKFEQQLNAACSIVEALAAMSPAGTPDSTVFDLGTRVAAVRYSEAATVSFDFLEGSSAAAICSSLTSITYVPGDFTLMHTAFEKVVSLFNSPDTGFRGTLYNVPSEMIMFTNADSLSTNKIFEGLATLKAIPTHHLHRTVVRLTYSNTEDVLQEVTMAGIVDTAGQVERCASAECLSNTTALVSTVSNGIMARAPCATGCVPRANVMFLVDSSTSIEENEAGGAPGDYQAIRNMIGDTIGQLSQYIDNGYMQVGAMTFATDATSRITLGKSTATALKEAVAGIPYDHEEGGDDVTDTNLHKALAAVSAMESFGAPKGAAQFIVVITDGVMRNQAGDASSLLESELNKLDAKIERIVMGTGSRSDEATLLHIASRSGYVGRVSDANASATVAQQVLDAAGLCLSEDDRVFTTPTPAETTAADATGVTAATTAGTGTVDDSTCQVLKVQADSGCETLVSNLGCDNPYVAILCASSCERCASDCAAFHPDNVEKCVRCKNNKYLSNFECVDTCGEGLVPVQTGKNDGAYGRACLAVGGVCDNYSPTQQCKPPVSLGSCRVSLLTKSGSRCQECEDGKFLVKGRCYNTLRCKGQYLEREIEDQVKCNCHFKENGEVNKDCYRCTVMASPTSKTLALAAGAPRWVTSHYHPKDAPTDQVHRECQACRNSKLFYDRESTCIDKDECPSNYAVYSPKPYYGTCEPAFTCKDKRKDTTNKNCVCPQRGCTECLYGPQVSFPNGPTCSRCVSKKFLVQLSVSYAGKEPPTQKTCVADWECIKLGGNVIQSGNYRTCQF